MPEWDVPSSRKRKPGFRRLRPSDGPNRRAVPPASDGAVEREQQVGPGGLTIRLARPHETATWRALTKLARVPPEAFLECAITSGAVSRILLTAIESGQARNRLERAAAQTVTKVRQRPDALQEELERFVAGVALPLVAVDEDGAVGGALQGMVSGLVVMGLLERGFPLTTVMSFATRAVKVAALGVAADVRGRGLGRSLLRACCEIYFAAGYDFVHGSFRKAEAPALAGFYTRAGFELPTRPVTLPLNGITATLDVDARDQQMFVMSRRRWLQLNDAPGR